MVEGKQRDRTFTSFGQSTSGLALADLPTLFSFRDFSWLVVDQMHTASSETIEDRRTLRPGSQIETLFTSSLEIILTGDCTFRTCTLYLH